MNTILIVLIVVVIYLIHISSPKKEAFGFNPYEDATLCNKVNTIDDCKNRLLGTICRDKCEPIEKSFYYNSWS
jgi:hypothetical protein